MQTKQECRHTSFELVEVDVQEPNYKIRLVECSNCGWVVGVINHKEILTLLGLNKQMSKIEERLEKLEADYRDLLQD